MYSIGEVSKMTQLSVRTLRYYDEIGLLKPSSYTEGNHRLYTEKDVVVLRKIMFLKKLGFSLQKIKKQLQGDTDWEQFLQFQYDWLKKEKQKIEHMMQGIGSAMRSYQVEGEVDWKKLFVLYQYAEKMERKEPPSFSAEEKEIIEKMPRFEGEDPETKEWINLFQKIKELKTHPPDSLEVQKVVGKMIQKSAAMFGNDPEKMEKAWEMRKLPKPEYRYYPIDEKIIRFLDEAFAVYYKNTES